jgi:RNA polymerase sigma-70 factor (ECF subfamily)
MTDNTEIQQRVKEAKSGDTLSMAFLFQLYRPQLYAHALRVVGNPMAYDVVQDTFISAFTHISSLRDISLFYPWLKKILLNNCYLALRKEKSALNYRLALTDDSLIEESIEQRMENTANTQQIYSALSGLSAELRSCVLIRYFSNFGSYEEIGLILGIPIGTVRSRLAAARAKLYAVYSHYNGKQDKAFMEAKHWSEYYLQIWKKFYDDPNARNEFIRQLNPALHIRYTSGSSGTGRALLEKEFNDDLQYGSRFHVKDVNSCGNISVMEGINTNSPEYPDRCAPSSVIVLFRNKGKMIDACNIFDSPRTI